MTRPIYESAQDRELEARFAGFIEQHLKTKLVKLPISYKLDYVQVDERNEVMGFVELKRRTYSSTQLKSMGGYMLSLNKLMAARDLCGALRVPFTLALWLADGVFVSEFSPGTMIAFTNVFTFKTGGRKDRNDWQDMEPVAMVQMYEFDHVRDFL